MTTLPRRNGPKCAIPLESFSQAHIRVTVIFRQKCEEKLVCQFRKLQEKEGNKA